MTDNAQSPAYDELVAAIVKSVPDVVQWWCIDCDCEARNPSEHDHDRETASCVAMAPHITPEDVLLWLRTIHGDEWAITSSGELILLVQDLDTLEPRVFRWHAKPTFVLGQSLAWHRDHKPETITFLHNLLCQK